MIILRFEVFFFSLASRAHDDDGVLPGRISAAFPSTPVSNDLEYAAVLKCVVALRMIGAIMDENQKGELVTSPTCQRTHIVQPQASNSRRAVVDALAGSVSGVCGVIVGQPFDTIRVRQQTKAFASSSGSSMISLIRKPFAQCHAG